MKKVQVTKFLSLISFVVVSSVQSTPSSNTQQPTEASVSEYTSNNHRFSGLTLKGELKQPEFTYHPEKKGPRPEELIVLPENFDSAIYELTQER
jgi:hypothetical protein